MCTRELLSSWSLSCVPSVSAVPLCTQDEKKCQGLEPERESLKGFGPKLPLTHSECSQDEMERLMCTEIQRDVLKYL